MAKKFNVLIIGAGNIGAFFDSPKSSKILTHAHAFSKHPKFKLLGFYDIDNNKAKQAAKIWKVKYFDTLTSAFGKNKVDVVCVAVPDIYHYDVLKNIVKYQPKLVLSEKPLTNSFTTAKKITHLYKKYNIPLLINYSRRFVPEFIKLKNEIDNKKYGKLVTGIGYYGKGILHNGSHLTNLLRYYFGEIKIRRILDREHDYFKNDPSVSAELSIKQANFLLQHVNSQLYTIFEIDLFFEKARIRILNSGFMVEKYLVEESRSFKGYKYLVKKEEYKTSLDYALYYTAEHIYRVLNHKTRLNCPADNALEDIKLCTNTFRGSLQ